MESATRISLTPAVPDAGAERENADPRAGYGAQFGVRCGLSACSNTVTHSDTGNRVLSIGNWVLGTGERSSTGPGDGTGMRYWGTPGHIPCSWVGWF